MEIKVWAYFKKKTNSTKRPDNNSAITLTGYFRNSDPFSAYAPVITFQSFLDIQTGEQSIPKYNYCYIDDFKRYYWIVDWVHNEGIWTAKLNVDLLASFKDDIGSKSMYITRSAAAFNTYVEDSKYPITSNLLEYKDNVSSVWVQRPNIQQAILDPNIWNKNIDQGCYIINAYGPNGAGITSYLCSWEGFTALARKLYDFSITDSGLWETVTTQLPEGFAKAVADPLQFIAGVYWYPVSIAGISTSDTINLNLGYYNIGNISGMKALAPGQTIVSYECTVQVRKHPQASRGEYLNCSPYSEYKLQIPPFGDIDLDPSKLQYCNNIKAKWYVDYRSGASKLYIYGVMSTGFEFYLGMVEAKFGVEVPLNQNTINLSESITKSSLLYGTIGALGSVGNMLQNGNYGMSSETKQLLGNKEFGLAVEVPVFNLPNMGDIANAAMGGFASFNPGLAPKLSTVGGIASFLTFTSGVSATLHSTFYYIVDEDNQNIGRPLCEIRRPMDLGGYMIAENPKIELLGTLMEIEGVKQFLVSGFYYE